MTGCAKQSRATHAALDCFVASLLAMAMRHNCAFSRQAFVRGFQICSSPQKQELPKKREHFFRQGGTARPNHRRNERFFRFAARIESTPEPLADAAGNPQFFNPNWRPLRLNKLDPAELN
jgi:hypothetical protein